MKNFKDTDFDIFLFTNRLNLHAFVVEDKVSGRKRDFSQKTMNKTGSAKAFILLLFIAHDLKVVAINENTAICNLPNMAGIAPTLHKKQKLPY